jgi:regulator of RNase E activity RraB
MYTAVFFMTFPNDETGQVLTEMKQAGINLNIIHPIVFFQLFEKKEQAQAMAAHLAQKAPNMLVSLHQDETPNVWDLDCTVNMLPDHDAIVAQEAQFEQIAAKFNGYNDGWGIQT